MEDLLDIEERGWQALSSEGNAAKRFYASVLAEDAVMVFPGGLLLEGKERILASMEQSPWQKVQIETPRLVSLSNNARAIVYKVTAQREGDEPYTALISSTYALREGKWRLIVHQQTPT